MLDTAKHAKQRSKQTLYHAILQRDWQASSARRSGPRGWRLFARRHKKRKLAVILPHNDLSVNVEIEDSFNKCSMISISVFQSRGIIFSLRSNLLRSKFHSPSASRFDHAFVAGTIRSAPGL
jgi:hypothetical protein